MRLILVCALLLAGPVAAAETYTCTDADNEVTVVFDYEAKAEQPFLRIDMQLTDDYGFTTVPGDPRFSGEFVEAHYASPGFIGADVKVRDENGRVSGLLAMGLRIVTVSEKPRDLITGGVSVGAGGVWTVVCNVDYGL